MLYYEGAVHSSDMMIEQHPLIWNYGGLLANRQLNWWLLT